jgi:DNA-binding transcriptional regulator YiaG
MVTSTCEVCNKTVTPGATHCRKCRSYSLPGEKNPAHKLSNDDVVAIRRTTDTTLEQLARRYNISRQRVSLVKRHLAWTHI